MGTRTAAFFLIFGVFFAESSVAQNLVANWDQYPVSPTYTGSSGSYVVEITNAGSNVIFRSGEVIFSVSFAEGIELDSVERLDSVGVQGQINCRIAGQRITCTAAGTVEFADSGTVTGLSRIYLEFAFRALSSGNYEAPTGALCEVDPENVIVEFNESNSCSGSAGPLGARP